MNQVVEFFTGLFATDQWPARWHCGEWSDFHGWLYILSDLTIWLAYFLIPIIIIKYFAGKKGKVKFSKVYLLFASFILLCGSTHFIDAMMFWLPMYRLNGLVRLATAIVSMLTVYNLIKILPSLFAQQTNLELENEIIKRKEVELKLAEANTHLASFAHVASHDLQEPLRKIRTFADMLLSNEEGLTVKNKQLANKIEIAAERMQNLVKDVLAISTIEDDMELKPTNVNDALNIAISDLEIKIEEKKVDIKVDTIPTVLGNQLYLSQVFLNIIGNAIKFSVLHPKIYISGRTENDKVFISIADNGIGIDEEHLEKIFQTFKRLHSKEEYEGSGIGLSICKRIIDLHNGNISVTSKVDEGTTFLIELPKG